MKKCICALLILTFIFLPVSADIRVCVNNEEILPDTAPEMQNGRILISMRCIFEALGASVSFDNATRTATGVCDGHTVSVTEGETDAAVDQKTIPMDLAAKIQNGRMMVPIRFISEALGCTVRWQEKTETVFITNADNTFSRPLTVHFLDVGQADSILLLLPSGEEMLIDAGNNNDGDDVSAYIAAQGVTDLEYVIGTHPHEDHIGGLDDVLNAFPVRSLYMPRQAAATKTFRDVTDAVKENDIPLYTAVCGTTIYDRNGLSVRILSPEDKTYKDVNNSSVVLSVTYLNRTFLFMGDAGTDIENTLCGDLHADVLKVGHHGSYTASGTSFLRLVSPLYAVISVGCDNSYGHPHKAVLSRLADLGATVLRTDIDGTVVFSSDGDSLTLSPAA